MKRTDITELFPDATKEQIDKIMSINGADVNAIKTELDTLRQQLAQNNKGEELQQAQMQISQLQTQLDGMKAAETIRLTREKDLEVTQKRINDIAAEGWELQQVISPNDLGGAIIGIFFKDKNT